MSIPPFPDHYTSLRRSLSIGADGPTVVLVSFRFSRELLLLLIAAIFVLIFLIIHFVRRRRR